ncbi:serine/arginine repetitive matrix protein 2 [Harryflintia acetispora]|uniref:DUF2313 domain-containing protein n=1 Tax=Harryflintia acetispora TaxID=1849041 RepID=A0A9X8Y819_9FIRM|nr:serine/arginine repetitive matrix protein 2 [Harryflintia acetispora]TCL43231.1 hypothetical protein EDD78_10691 [Harryflintia acetispora]
MAFDKFADYMYSLLFTPLRKGRKLANQFNVFFAVIGKLFDDGKQDLLRAREELNVISASEGLLPEHGKDRDMQRLNGETEKGYRTRLSMKAVIAEKAGTIPGILLALAALGYEYSQIIPMRRFDRDRWAEFIVLLRGSGEGVKDLSLIDAEVRKVKQASSKPAYGSLDGNQLEIRTFVRTGMSYYPLCNTINCGVWPDYAAVGRLYACGVELNGLYTSGLVEQPQAATVRASGETYTREDLAIGRAYIDTQDIRSFSGAQQEGVER